LPALAARNTPGRAVTCLNNLKQWGVITIFYASKQRHPATGRIQQSHDASQLANGWYFRSSNGDEGSAVLRMPWRTNAAIDQANLSGSVQPIPGQQRK